MAAIRQTPHLNDTQSAPTASGRQIAKGAAWMLLFKMADKGLGFISTLILARLLVPADFGLVAMAMAVVAMTQLLSAFGFDTALIQRQDVQREHFDTAWTFNLIFGTCIAALLGLLAYPAASFYGDSRLVPVLLVLACSALVGGLENIGTVAFRKELDFRSEFRFLFFKRAASFIVTVALALALQNYWALVGGTLFGRVASALISYRIHPYRPRFSLAARRDLMQFSKWILISSALHFLQSRSADFILGRTVGPHAVGIYTVAIEIATLPSTEMVAPINRAVFPAYTQLTKDAAALRARFRSVFGLICLISFPICATLFAIADPAVRLLLGDKWIEAIPVIQVFCIAGLMNSLQSNLILVVLALGHPRANTALSAGVLLVSLPSIVWASVHYGVQGAVYVQLLSSTALGLGIAPIMLRLSGTSPTVLLAAMWRPALAGAFMLLTLQAATWALPHGISPVLVLAVLLALALLLAPLFTLALWWLAGRPVGAEHEVVNLVRRWRLARVGSPA